MVWSNCFTGHIRTELGQKRFLLVTVFCLTSSSLPVHYTMVSIPTPSLYLCCFFTHILYSYVSTLFESLPSTLLSAPQFLLYDHHLHCSSIVICCTFTKRTELPWMYQVFVVKYLWINVGTITQEVCTSLLHLLACCQKFSKQHDNTPPASASTNPDEERTEARTALVFLSLRLQRA